MVVVQKPQFLNNSTIYSDNCGQFEVKLSAKTFDPLGILPRKQLVELLNAVSNVRAFWANANI
jgi:hypothetical protein